MKLLQLFICFAIAGWLISSPASASKIEVEDQFDLKLAFDFAYNNQIDTLVLVTDGGVYTTTDTTYLQVKHPMVIIAAPGLVNKPIITHSDAQGTEIEIIRIHDDLTVEGIIFDGGHPATHGMKHGLRVGEGPNGIPQPKVGLNVTVRNCEFRNFFEDKDPALDGHAFYFLQNVDAGTVRFEDCKFANFGYEAIRMSETEKYPIDRVVDTLIVRNCSFTNVDAECIRFYADTSQATPDAYVLLENLTIDGSATRTMFIKNNAGTIVRNVLVTNSRTSGHGRDDYVLQIQQTGSIVSHVDTFNVRTFLGAPPSSGRISATKGGMVDTTTIYGFDPMYEDAANENWTLLPGSPVCNIGYGGGAISDHNWAGNCPPAAINDDDFRLPDGYRLSQNYPNPFNPATVMDFYLPRASTVALRIYDVQGALVKTLLSGHRNAGEYSVEWQADGVASGVYFYRLEVDGKFATTRRMVLMK